MKKTIMILLLLPELGGGLHAQFFKKILDNVKQTAQNRANGKASQTTDKAIDKVLEPGPGKKGTAATGEAGALPVDTAGVNKVLGAFAKAASENPNDTSAADITMKALRNLTGGGRVSPADSAAAIKAFMTAQGGSGVCYQTLMTMVTKSKGTIRDTNTTWFTNNGEGRVEMRIPVPGVQTDKMIILGRIALPRYSMNLNGTAKTYSLNVIDTALINNSGHEYTATKIGEETVAGYRCMHARLTGNSRLSRTSMDTWTSTAVPGYSLYKQLVNMSKITPGMLSALDKAGCTGYLVKMTTGDKGYSMTMELLKAEVKSMPASLFRIPSGYQLSDEGMLGSLLSGARTK
jgi:hypothetical protein